MKLRHLIPVLLAFPLLSPPVLAQQAGKELYIKTCVVCHGTGIAGAPKYGNAADWGPRIAAGMPRLYSSALKGTPKGMPAKGGNPANSDADVKAAVDYMVAAVKGATKPESVPAEVVKSVEQKAAVAAAAPVQGATAAAPSAAASAPNAGDVNAFNRLLKPASKRNPPPPEDGIHDPTNDGTHALLPPLTAYAGLPKSFAGNRVNWVEAIQSEKITPRYDRNDPNAQPVVMDLNIVREVKGYMPDVVYPHKQHTQWLDCSNCHPAIFIPQKGANAISMAAILMGEKCGVCHGKVAFPVSECRICHSKKKDIPRPAQTAVTPPN